MPAAVPAWLSYHRWNRRDERMAELWVRGVVVLADLIPTRYSKPLDACRSLWVAARHGVLPAMLVHLWKAARSPDGVVVHQIDPERTAELAAAAGFACERLPVNLTPSRRRFTCVLTASPVA